MGHRLSALVDRMRVGNARALATWPDRVRPGTALFPIMLFIVAGTFVYFGGLVPARAANGSVTYAYDALGRILSESYDTGVVIVYTYDANGNRTSQTINVNTTTGPLCWDTTSGSCTTNQWDMGLWGS